MIRTVGTLIGLVVLLPAAALAQGAPPMPGPGVVGPGGGMTLQAFQAKHRAKLMELDTNHDGRISMAEFAAKPGRDGQPRDPGKAFARFDLNHDGFLDAREIDAMDAVKFRKKDRNGDGVVTRDEHGRHGAGGPVPQQGGMAPPSAPRPY